MSEFDPADGERITEISDFSVSAEDGCVRYDYYLSEKDPDELLLIEQWQTKDHQQVHMTQPHMAQMRNFKDDFVASTTLGEIELK